jgi:hypothetical protein
LPRSTSVWGLRVIREMAAMPGSGERKVHRVRRAPFMVIGIFLLLWFVGISLDEPKRVLEQAVQVCLSCIGLG